MAEPIDEFEVLEMSGGGRAVATAHEAFDEDAASVFVAAALGDGGACNSIVLDSDAPCAEASVASASSSSLFVVDSPAELLLAGGQSSSGHVSSVRVAAPSTPAEDCGEQGRGCR